MNKLIVPSIHSKETFNQTKYKIKISETEEVDLVNKTPIDVVSYSIRSNSNLNDQKLPIELESSFNFLSVAQWGPRKNVEATITAFLGEFFNEPDFGLILKLNIAKNSCMKFIHIGIFCYI